MIKPHIKRAITFFFTDSSKKAIVKLQNMLFKLKYFLLQIYPTKIEEKSFKKFLLILKISSFKGNKYEIVLKSVILNKNRTWYKDCKMVFLVWKAIYETSLDSELIRTFKMPHFFTMVPHL